MTEILKESNEAGVDFLVHLPARAGHYLKLLSAIMQPFRHSQDALPVIEEPVRDALCEGLNTKFAQLKRAFDYRSATTREHLTECTLFLARLLQYFLGFQDIWKGRMVELGDDLLQGILDLAIIHGQGTLTHPIAFMLLLDTAFYIFDGKFTKIVFLAQKFDNML